MQKLGIWIGCALLAIFIVACDEEEETAEEPDEPAVEETDDSLEPEEEPDEDAEIQAAVDELLSNYEEECREVMCEQAIECHIESDEVDDPEFTVEECSDAHCARSEELHQRYYDAAESVEYVERCSELGTEVIDCLRDLSRDELVAFTHPEFDSDEICAEEMAAQNDECATLVEVQQQYEADQQAGDDQESDDE